MSEILREIPMKFNSLKEKKSCMIANFNYLIDNVIAFLIKVLIVSDKLIP